MEKQGSGWNSWLKEVNEICEHNATYLLTPLPSSSVNFGISLCRWEEVSKWELNAFRTLVILRWEERTLRTLVLRGGRSWRS